MPFLPFRLMPASWGLKGDAYEEAKAHYELSGKPLDRALAEIRIKDLRLFHEKLLDIDLKYGDLTPYDHAVGLARITHEGNALDIELIEIDRRFNKLTNYDARCKTLEITHPEPSTERDLLTLEIDHMFGNLSVSEFDKQRATLRDEPWIGIISSGFDPSQGIDGVFFEFDWNKAWIEFLKLNGYVGHTDEQIVDDWFTDVCRSYTNAELASTAPFPKDFGALP